MNRFLFNNKYIFLCTDTLTDANHKNVDHASTTANHSIMFWPFHSFTKPNLIADNFSCLSFVPVDKFKCFTTINRDYFFSNLFSCGLCQDTEIILFPSIMCFSIIYGVLFYCSSASVCYLWIAADMAILFINISLPNTTS